MLNPVARLLRDHARSALSLRGRLLSKQTQCLQSGAYRRAFSVARERRDVRYETVSIPYRAKSSVTVDIFRPTSFIPFNKRCPIVIYLPQGMSIQPLEEQYTFASVLSEAALAVVVKINYDLSVSQPYPLPIHQVLTGYDWVVSNAGDLLNNSQQHDTREDVEVGLGVYGESIGGSLATMLAMTECRVHDRTRVVAAVAKEPILDWVGLDAINVAVPRSKTKLKQIQQANPPSRATGPESRETYDGLSLAQLLELRQVSFRADRPGSYFDPFASPLLFLRSPGVVVPSTKPGSGIDDDFNILAGVEELELRDDGTARSKVDPQAVEDLLQKSPTTTSPFSINDTSTIRPRRMPKPYPPSGWAPLALPTFKFLVGQNSPLLGQIEDVIRLLRRNMVKYGDGTTKGMAGVKDELLQEVSGEPDVMGTVTKASEEKFQLEIIKSSVEPYGFQQNALNNDQDQDDYAKAVGQWF